jgi:hypothetical protein
MNKLKAWILKHILQVILVIVWLNVVAVGIGAIAICTQINKLKTAQAELELPDDELIIEAPQYIDTLPQPGDTVILLGNEGTVTATDVRGLIYFQIEDTKLKQLNEYRYMIEDEGRGILVLEPTREGGEFKIISATPTFE